MVDGVVRTEVATQPSVEFGLPSSSYVICRSVTSRLSDFAVAPSGQRGTLPVAVNADGCIEPVLGKCITSFDIL